MEQAAGFRQQIKVRLSAALDRRNVGLLDFCRFLETRPGLCEVLAEAWDAWERGQPVADRILGPYTHHRSHRLVLSRDGRHIRTLYFSSRNAALQAKQEILGGVTRT